MLYYYKEVKRLEAVRNFVIYKYDPGSTFKTFANAKEAAEYYVDTFRKHYEDRGEVSEIKQVSIDGLDAFRIDIVMEGTEYLEKQIIVIFMKDETLFEANGICLADDQEGIEEIEAMLKSLRIR